MKTVRFTQVVQRSGRPHVHTLWVAPEKDPEFSRAREANRVMTLENSGTGRADVGLIGFDSKHARSGQFLIFPKSLKPFRDARVIGIKFDLVEQPDLVAAPAAIVAPPPRKRARVAATPIPFPVQLPAAEVKSEPATATDVEEPAEKAEARKPPRHQATKREPPAPKRRGKQPREAIVQSETPEKPAIPQEPATVASEGSSAPAAVQRKLLREVKLALKELKAGKAVAAYQRLEHAVAAAEK